MDVPSGDRRLATAKTRPACKTTGAHGRSLSPAESAHPTIERRESKSLRSVRVLLGQIERPSLRLRATMDANTSPPEGTTVEELANLVEDGLRDGDDV